MLKIYNTLTKKKELFKPLKDKKIGMYVCGPTVYGPSHLGHARTYIAFDVIRRYLEYLKYQVNYIVNITDIHDDIIKKAQEENMDIFSLASKYIPQFYNDLSKLGIKRATKYPRVTEHMRQILELIKKLEEKGYTYQSNGSVYYNISKFKDYGNLSGIKIEKEKTSLRIQTDKYDKKSPADFVLWKEMKPGETYWQSPWGAGRPGWHIECSAMSMEYLGEQFDIHGGAVDLIFPHHENEIAQSEAATGKKPFVKYWMHTGALTVNGTKMSRSLGNYIEIPDVLKNYSPMIIRFFVILSHYRSPLDFNEAALNQTKASYERIIEFLERMADIITKKPKKSGMRRLTAKKQNTRITKILEDAKEKFIAKMNDDFNTPLALAVIFDLIKKMNKSAVSNKISSDDAKAAIRLIKEINSIFSIIDKDFLKNLRKKRRKIPSQIEKLLDEREKCRQKKNWQKADELRKKIEALGYLIEDTKIGPIIKRKI